MYVAMNRFQVHAGREAGFEATWRDRNRYVHEVEGFLGFMLLRGDTEEGLTPYISHSTWSSKEAFLAWTRSDAFVRAHRDARSPDGTLAGPPVFSGWESVLHEQAGA